LTEINPFPSEIGQHYRTLMLILMKKYWPILVLVGAVSCTPNPNEEREQALPPIARLLEGNARYVDSDSNHPHQSRERLKEISDAQNPFAIVVSCSDSRLPPEIIFDQGLGDLFVIRTAGNVIGDYELASIEYAVLKLNCNVIVVMGHEKCGAIQAFAGQPNKHFPGHLDSIKEFIQSEPNSLKVLQDTLSNHYHAVIHNIIYGVQLLKRESDVIQEKFDMHELEIYGAVYRMETGRVQVIEDEVKE
jgi:carbonic anhydrase